jgi:WD40 repeat protein
VIETEFQTKPQIVWASSDGFHIFSHYTLRNDCFYIHYLPTKSGYRSILSKPFKKENFNYYVAKVGRDNDPFVINASSSMRLRDFRVSNKLFYDQELFAEYGAFKVDRLGNNIVFVGSAGPFLRFNCLFINQNKIFTHYSECLERSWIVAKISPDGKTVAAARGKEIVFFDLETIEQKYTLVNRAKIVDIAYSQDGLTLAVITEEGFLVVWDVE